VRVDDRKLQKTRNTRAVALIAEIRRGVDEVALSSGLNLYYRLTTRAGRPTEQVDRLKRRVLEAFGALPMDRMSQDIDAYRLSLRGVEGAEWDAAHASTLITPLVEFVRTFGPIGIGWGGEFGVKNPVAARLRRDADRERLKRMGIDAEGETGRRSLGSEFWTVSFWGHAPGRGAVPDVRQRFWYPDQPWATRLRYEDEGIPHDFWPRIVDEHRDLIATLELVEAIARRDQFRCRDAARVFHPGDNAEFWVGEPNPMRPSYGRAVRGSVPSSGWLALFRVPTHRVDWVVLGRGMLADLIARQIDFAMPLVDVSDDEVLGVRWQAKSVLEAVYLQLLDHVRRREAFGIGHCGDCEGPIMRTKPPGVTGNQWHQGCQAGRVRRWRQENPDWRQRRTAPRDDAQRLARARSRSLPPATSGQPRPPAAGDRRW
jgi:hypothetical protein